MHELQELVRLHRRGEGARAVARMLKMSPNTERRYRKALDAAGLLAGESDAELPALEELKRAVDERAPVKVPAQQRSSVERWADDIERKLRDGAKPKAIFDWLRQERPGFDGQLGAIKRICRRLIRDNDIVTEDVVIPVDTGPGEVAQVDFGSIGKRLDPERMVLRQAYVFVMVLGHSRHMYAKIVFDQKVETWLECHVDAFAYFGGVPRVLVPDNLKAAVIRAAFGEERRAVLNRSYRELARHYGFAIDPTPPRSPEKKGKVESGVKYVKNNFFKSRADELAADVLGEQLARWLVEVAGRRIHGTTRASPLERFEAAERSALGDLPPTPWEPIQWCSPKLHRNCHAQVLGAEYSAPWRLVGKRLLARATRASVELYFDDARVATHRRGATGTRTTIEEHLPDARRDYRHRSREYWEERADALGKDVGKYIREVFDSDDVLYQLKTVQQLVTMLEGYPRVRATAACRRASFYGNYTYGGVKNLLKRALDQLPLPDVVLPERGGLDRPRFARDVRELLTLPLENTDAPH